MISIHDGRAQSWAPCLVTVDEMEQLLGSMHHLGSILTTESAEAPREGRSVWVGSCGGNPIGLSWRWGEVRRNVLALADPMAIESNVRFAGRHGNTLSDGERTLYLNALVHGLDWQGVAARATSGLPAASPEVADCLAA